MQGKTTSDAWPTGWLEISSPNRRPSQPKIDRSELCTSGRFMEASVTRLLFRIALITLTLVVATAGCAAWGEVEPGKFDGPAELPRAYVKSALSDTPAPGKSILVKDA